ncbi:MAG: LytR/AlgR family response regulator transcription factor [Roseburia faecis]
MTISLENILYIESNLHRLVFYMVGEDAVHYTIYMKLDDIAELLPNKDFCRIHKSYLVNLKYVESVERYRAVLSNGKSLAISKARFLDTRNEFACYRGEI